MRPGILLSHIHVVMITVITTQAVYFFLRYKILEF